MIPELTLVEDVADAFAAIVGAAVGSATPGTPVRLCCSGGTTGRACAEALVRADVDLSGAELFFADERCVTPDSPDANERTWRDALGERVAALAGFHPMRCADGADAYEALLRAGGPLDVLQLGVGPDGHTASLFAGSPALVVPPGRLVAPNEDPSGRNAHARLTLTYEAIAAARLVVVTVSGADKHAVLARLAAGEDLPAARLAPGETVWLVDAPAAGTLAARPASASALADLGRRPR